MDSSASVITLSALARQISSVVRHVFGPQRFWVVADVIGLKVSRGHCYLQLAEKDEITITPKAEFRAIIWADNFQLLHDRFIKETGASLREQLQILCCVEVQFHERYGLSLIIHDLDPSYTLGQLELDRRKTVERLKKDGIYDLNRSRELPAVIRKVAVISAEDSRGYEDFIKRLTDNSYGYKFNVKLYPSLLQGNMAAGDIISKLIAIYDHLPVEPFDAVLIVRGGGGASSLGCFNDYQLSRAVARFPLAIITGIGHTANQSVVDEVANTSLITPTDAAVFLLNRMYAFEQEINGIWEDISALFSEKIEDEKSFLENAVYSLSNEVSVLLNSERQQLETHFYQYRHIALQILNAEKADLRIQSNKMQSAVQHRSDTELRELEIISRLIIKSMKELLKREEEKIGVKEEKLNGLKPESILKRGFSYTLKDGKMISDASLLNKEDEITTVFNKGKIKSKVSTIDHGGKI